MKLPIQRYGTKGNPTHYQLDPRPWPQLAKPLVLKQIWHDLVFARWPASVDHPHPLIPMDYRLILMTGRHRLESCHFVWRVFADPRCDLFCILRDDRMSLYGCLLLSADNFRPDSL
jgi:hypothetical protein